MKSLAQLMDDSVLDADIDSAIDACQAAKLAQHPDTPGKNNGLFNSESGRKPSIDDWIAGAAWNRTEGCLTREATEGRALANG
jgi:hypothetical protein